MFDGYQYITDVFIKALEEEKIPWKMPWMNGDERIPCNGYTKESYHGINIFILTARAIDAGFERNYWMGYDQAMRMGGHVKKGEKHTKIIKWNVKYDKEDPSKVLYMYPMYLRVWNLEQTEGVSITQETRVFNPIEEAEKIVEGMPNKPKIVYGIQRACYIPAEDTVNMPQKHTFVSDEKLYSTLLHELAHSTKAPQRLSRSCKSYAEEELVAEMTASFLCADAGIIQETIENSKAYCQSWVKEFRDKPKMILKAAGMAEKAAGYIRNQPAIPTKQKSA